MATAEIAFGLAQAASADARVLIVWLVSLVALGVAILGRRDLPAGVTEGLFITALSSGLLLNNTLTAPHGQAEWLRQGAVGLASLAVLWFLVVLWVERDAPPTAAGPAASRYRVRRLLGGQAAVVAGLLTVGVVLAWAPAAQNAEKLSLAGPIVLLLAVAAGAWLCWRGELLGYACLAALLVLLWLSVPRSIIEPHRLELPAALLAVAAAALATVVATILHHWRRRVRSACSDPAALLERPPKHALLYGVVIVLGVLVGVAAVLLAGAALASIATMLAGLTVMAVGHRRCSNRVGELGLGLTAGGVIMVAGGWSGGGWTAFVLGWALAGAWLLWLARFWQQQLHDGQPWTTAGRLIPAARRLGHVAAGGALVTAVAAALTFKGVSPGEWTAVIAAMLLLALWGLLMRDARSAGSSTAALLAGLVLLAGLAAVARVAAAWGGPVPAVLVVGLAALVLAVRAAAARGSEVEWTYNALIGGVIPVIVVHGLLLGDAWQNQRVAACIALACVLLAGALRWLILGRRGPGLAGGAGPK